MGLCCQLQWYFVTKSEEKLLKFWIPEHGPDLVTDLNSHIGTGELLSLFNKSSSVCHLQNLQCLLRFLKWEYTEAISKVGRRLSASLHMQKVSEKPRLCDDANIWVYKSMREYTVFPALSNIPWNLSLCCVLLLTAWSYLHLNLQNALFKKVLVSFCWLFKETFVRRCSMASFSHSSEQDWDQFL